MCLSSGDKQFPQSCRFGQRWMISLLFWLWGFLHPFSAWANDPPEELRGDPKVVRATFFKWPERITTLRMVWEETIHDPAGGLKQKRFLKFNRSINEWIWCQDGRCRLHIVSYVNDDFFENVLRTDDGEFAYEATYGSENAPFTSPINLSLYRSWTKTGGSPYSSKWFPNRSLFNFTLTPLEGIWLSYEGRWLKDRLPAEPLETWGYESLEDRVLPFVNFEFLPVVLVLDPEVGCLPRLTRTMAVQNYLLENRVDSFQEIEPGLWFPMSGTYRTRWYDSKERDENSASDEIRRWIVKEVQINRPVLDSEFEIRPGVGTVVHDDFMSHTFTYGPGMPPDTMENGLNRKLMDWLRSGTRGPHPFAPRKSAPPRERWKPVVLVILLLICLGVFAWMVHWRQREGGER